MAAQEYPDVAFDDRIIDALCMQLIQAPERFDVLVMPNLYGDVVAELGAGLVGGVGVAARRPLRGRDGRSWPCSRRPTARRSDLAGTNRADPFGADAVRRR